MRSLQSSWYTWLCKHGVFLVSQRIFSKKSNRNICMRSLQTFLVGASGASRPGGFCEYGFTRLKKPSAFLGGKEQIIYFSTGKPRRMVEKTNESE